MGGLTYRMIEERFAAIDEFEQRREEERRKAAMKRRRQRGSAAGETFDAAAALRAKRVESAVADAVEGRERSNGGGGGWDGADGNPNGSDAAAGVRIETERLRQMRVGKGLKDLEQQLYDDMANQLAREMAAQRMKKQRLEEQAREQEEMGGRTSAELRKDPDPERKAFLTETKPLPTSSTSRSPPLDPLNTSSRMRGVPPMPTRGEDASSASVNRAESPNSALPPRAASASAFRNPLNNRLGGSSSLLKSVANQTVNSTRSRPGTAGSAASSLSAGLNPHHHISPFANPAPSSIQRQQWDASRRALEKEIQLAEQREEVAKVTRRAAMLSKHFFQAMPPVISSSGEAWPTPATSSLPKARIEKARAWSATARRKDISGSTSPSAASSHRSNPFQPQEYERVPYGPEIPRSSDVTMMKKAVPYLNRAAGGSPSKFGSRPSSSGYPRGTAPAPQHPSFYDPAFYHLTIKLQHPNATLNDWIFNVVVTDVTDTNHLLRHTFKQIQVNKDLVLVFHPPGGVVFSPVEDLPWVASPESLFKHSLRIEVVSVHPCNVKVLDTMVFYGEAASEGQST